MTVNKCLVERQNLTQVYKRQTPYFIAVDGVQWLGHEDIGTTGNIYTHLTRLRKENIGKDLENVFRR